MSTSPRSARRRAFAIVAVVTAAALASAGPESFADAARQQTPVFRDRVDIVPFDFLAYGPGGRPVTDLTVKDIRLLVDGRPREIASFQFVKLAATSVEAPATKPASPPLPLPFASNDAATPGRRIIVVVDHEQIRAADSKAALNAVKGFIDRLTPLDRAAVVTLPNGRVEMDLTTNHARIKAALDQVVGRAARRTGISNISLNEALNVLAEVLDGDKTFTQDLVRRECQFAPEVSSCQGRVVQEALQYARETERNSRYTLIALKDFLTGLGDVESPTAVLFLSGTLVSFQETLPYFEDVGRAAARGRVQMFVIQPHEPILDAQTRDQPPSMGLDADRRVEGLRDLASITGGEFVRLAGTGLPVMTRIADDLSSHYLIGFAPQRGEQDGKPHKIQITPARPGVTIRARPTFILDDPKRAPPPPMVLETLLQESGIRRDVLLRTTAFAFRDIDPKHVKVVVALEPVDDAVTLTSAAFALIGPDGRSSAQWTEQGANVVIKPLITAAAVPPGDYRLRVAAADSAGRRGTVDLEFNAGLTSSGPLTLASLMPGVLEQGAFRPRLALPAASAIAGYLEFYGNLPAGAVLSSRFEIAKTADGPPVAAAKGSVQGTSQPTRFIASGEVPAATLAPGGYVLRAVILVDDKPVGSAVRTILRKP